MTMTTNVQSISAFIPPVANAQIADTERQGTLPVGPTGKVLRGGGDVPWHKRLALTKAPSPTAHHVLLVLGSFVSDGQKDAWPSVATLASMTGLSPRGVQKALRALEAANLVTTVTVSGRASRYRLACAYPASTPARGAPLPPHEVHPPPHEVHPKVQGKVLREVQAAAYVQGAVETVEKPQAESSSIEALTQPAEVTSIDVSSKPAEDSSIDPSSKPARHTCPSCGNDWPASYGTKCHKCLGKRTTAGHAAPKKGHFDGIWDGCTPTIPAASSERASNSQPVEGWSVDRRADGTFWATRS